MQTIGPSVLPDEAVFTFTLTHDKAFGRELSKADKDLREAAFVLPGRYNFVGTSNNGSRDGNKDRRVYKKVVTETFKAAVLSVDGVFDDPGDGGRSNADLLEIPIYCSFTAGLEKWDSAGAGLQAAYLENPGWYWTTHPDADRVHWTTDAPEVFGFAKEVYGQKGGGIHCEHWPKCIHVPYVSRLRNEHWLCVQSLEYADDCLGHKTTEVKVLQKANSVDNANMGPYCAKYVPVGGWMQRSVALAYLGASCQDLAAHTSLANELRLSTSFERELKKLRGICSG